MVKPYPEQPGMFDRGQGIGGIFGNVGRATSPYSNRLMLAGMGMLSGKNAGEGWEGAMKGLVAGSAMDTERKRERALQGLMNDPDSNLLAGFSQKERAIIAGDPELARSVIASSMKSGGTEWRRLSDNTLFNERTGETRPAGGGAAGGGSFLTGNALETQALRHLVDTGQMSEDQAAEWAAGKTITGPNGETLFISPGQLFDAAGMGGKKEDGQGGPRQITGPKVTEEQRKAKGFYERTLAADTILSDPAISAAGQGSLDKTLSGLPGSKYVTSTGFQQFDQAQRDFINAILRRESGAAISESEFENARQQYFPQPGEPPEVVQQKTAARRRAIQSLRESYEPVPITSGQQEAPAEDPLGLR